MQLELTTGDLLEAAVEIVVLPISPYLVLGEPWSGRLSQGGAGELAAELQQELDAHPLTVARPGTAITLTSQLSGGRRVLCLVVHDVFGDASAETVWAGLEQVLRQAELLEARSLALPPLTVPSGIVALEDFAWVLRQFARTDQEVANLRIAVVCATANEQAELAALLAEA